MSVENNERKNLTYRNFCSEYIEYVQKKSKHLNDGCFKTFRLADFSETNFILFTTTKDISNKDAYIIITIMQDILYQEFESLKSIVEHFHFDNDSDLSFFDFMENQEQEIENEPEEREFFCDCDEAIIFLSNETDNFNPCFTTLNHFLTIIKESKVPFLDREIPNNL